LNSKTPEELERENAYKKTEKKIEENKEEWEKFYDEQGKKKKDILKNAKPHKKAPEWKNFGFTSKKTDKTSEKPDQGKPNFIQPPKTPFEAMKMLFFGGIGIYLGSLLLAELFSMDASRTISTEEMLNLLK
jgi:hypothetical protein